MLDVRCCKSGGTKRLPMKFLMTTFYLSAICLVIGVFMCKKVIYHTCDMAPLIKVSECSVNDDMISIPLEKIMRAPQVLEQDNPKLIKKVATDYLTPPSQDDYALNNANDDDPSMGQSAEIIKLLKNKRNGFFVECGALDGETRSNTLIFEKNLGWEGVLIEGDPKNYNLVRQKKRKAWIVPACLSTTPFPNVVMFKQHFNIGKISNISINQDSQAGYAKVQCLPLYTILLALNRTKVDYFSLDIEGNEFEVLKAIPWDRTFSVEFIHVKDGKDAMKNFMRDKGYILYSEVRHSRGLANDFIFYHPKLLM